MNPHFGIRITKIIESLGIFRIKLQNLLHFIDRFSPLAEFVQQNTNPKVKARLFQKIAFIFMQYIQGGLRSVD